MSAYIDVDGGWALETLNRQGWLRSDIELHPVDSPVPADFTTHRAEAYQAVLVEKIENVVEQGDVPCLAIYGELTPVSVSDSDIVVRETQDPVEMDVISSRPPLYSTSAQMNEKNIERVFWDGETVVAWPTETDTEKLTLQGYQDTYSGTLAAASNVETFPIEVLPFAMNITVLPVLKDDETPVIPVFERSGSVASYPGSYGTIAGGLERLDRHPIDAGWQESIEELRIGPDVPPSEYVDRELISSVSPDSFRRGTVDSQPLYAIPDTDGQWLLYLTDSRMKVFGIIRDLEDYRPEICAMVETDLPWDIIEENHPATIEYDHLECVKFSADGIADFIEETSDISPALLGTMVVVGEAIFGDFIGRFSDHHTDPDRISSTVFEGFETTMCTREDSR